MNELALFAGAGGGLLASNLLGWNTIGAVEIERYPREVLLQRQRDGMLEPFPIWDDVRTFDGRPWRGLVDVVSGGFPCQDISVAGKGAGLAGDRSRLWFEYLRIVEEIRPNFVFAENSPNLRTRGLGTIIEGLTGLGYGVRWGVLGAWHVGANHKRNRMWVLAHSNQNKCLGKPRECGLERCGSICERSKKEHRPQSIFTIPRPPGPERVSDIPRMVDGVAHRVDRLKAVGNGQDPVVAAAAFNLLSEGLT